MEKEIKKRIAEILDKTFNVLDKCYKNNDEASGKANYQEAESRIIFPCYSSKECRISEHDILFFKDTIEMLKQATLRSSIAETVKMLNSKYS